MTKYGYYIEAEYETGYVHSDRIQDISPYALNDAGELGPNIFNDILEKRPEAVHGKMVRFSLIPENSGKRYDIDWTKVPENGRPIRYFKREMDTVGGVVTDLRIMSLHFGYQYTDTDGKNVEVVEAVI